MIRLIDVEKECLVVLRDSEISKARYAALSYVWGRTKQVKLEKRNEDTFLVPGIFSDTELPRTIRDSMILVKSLGFRWIWVDVLCICQGSTSDDIEDRQDQLSNMGNIYREALLTIIAAAGDSADAGLPGIRRGSRISNQQLVQIIDPDADSKHAGLALVSTCTSRPVVLNDAAFTQQDVDRSVWSQRAWTFQERCMSRRCLIFTSDQVHWVCDGAVFCEESSFEHPHIYEKSTFDTPLRVELFGGDPMTLHMKVLDGPLDRMTITRREFWTRYQRYVEAYSQRHMSFEGDIHSAFSAATEAFERLSGETFHWGHPRSRFGLSLSWKSLNLKSTLYRRKEKTTLPMTSLHTRVYLPSWSWMGWMGATEFLVDDARLEKYASNVCSSALVHTNMISARSVISCFEHCSYPLRFLEIQGSNRFNQATFRDKKPRQEYTVPVWQESDAQDVTWQDVQMLLPALAEARLQREPDGHILFFWTSSVLLSVERPRDLDVPRGGWITYFAEPSQPNVKDNHGRTVGSLDRMGEGHWNETDSATGLQQFVAIGRRAVLELPEFPPVILALQIRWENGIAHRTNIAEIAEEAWMAAGPTWKLIALA
jgi:hypothetical protein